MRIVLVEPEIPQNTGNIARTCAATGIELDLVRPLGFDVDEKAVRRAGLDYWHLVNLTLHESFDSFLSSADRKDLVFFTSKASRSYTEIDYTARSILVFGSETRGLSDSALRVGSDRLARIPTLSEARCLNLSNAVAIAAYEALRQTGFAGLEMSRGL